MFVFVEAVEIFVDSSWIERDGVSSADALLVLLVG